MSTAEVTQWIQAQYPKPKLDPDWVNACVEFLQRELQLDPVLQADDIAQQTLGQMLQSDLGDSMLRDTGFPAGIRSMKNGVIGTRETGGPLLVQVSAITEIGASAFTLANVQQSRLDKADMTGLTKEKDDNNEEGEARETGRDVDEEDVTMPPYPRSMLSLMLDDGTVRIKAFEFKKLPQLILGETPLGCKILLRGVRVRNGIAMLEPATTEVLGHQNDDMQENADIDFLKSLRRRMGKPEEDSNDERLAQREQEQIQPPPQNPLIPPRAQQTSPLTTRKPGPARPQSPYFESTPSPEPKNQPPADAAQTAEFNDSFTVDDFEMDDEFLQEMDAVEKRVLNASIPAPSRSTQVPPSPKTPISSKPTQKNLNKEVIELDSDSDEVPPNRPPSNRPPPRRAARPVPLDTIDLSD